MNFVMSRQHLVKLSSAMSWKTDPVSIESLALKKAAGKSQDICMLPVLCCFSQVITQKKRAQARTSQFARRTGK